MEAETFINTTEPGLILGTPAYMSPNTRTSMRVDRESWFRHRVVCIFS